MYGRTGFRVSRSFILIGMKKSNSLTKPGRPREFDVEKALDAALDLFWRNGYEGTSLSDLTEAMGINRPSLYAAFGSKEELFRRVMDRYEARAADAMQILEGSPAREAIQNFLSLAVSGQCTASQARGCLFVQGALACSDESEHVRQELAQRRGKAEAAVRNRLERAAAEGELPPDANPADLARFFATVSQGLSVQAAGGANRDELLAVIANAMRAWP